MAFDNLLIERDAAVAVITINRPKVLNALSTATLDDLRHAVLELKRDDAIRAIVITGSGDKSFVAGADINELAVHLPPSLPHKRRLRRRTSFTPSITASKCRSRKRARTKRRCLDWPRPPTTCVRERARFSRSANRRSTGNSAWRTQSSKADNRRPAA